MAGISKNHISLVALGGQNPQILTVDFLRTHKIVPENKPPFSEIFQGEKPFTEFLSTPPFTRLVIGSIEFVVDERRFQIRDHSVSEWAGSVILGIAEKYFGVLPHTPLKVVGLNLNSTITFDSIEEAGRFQGLFFPDESPIIAMVSKESVSASSVLRFPYSEDGGRVTLTIERADTEKPRRGVNFNYEFDFTDWSGFKTELQRVPEIAQCSDGIFRRLIEAL